MNAVLKFKEGRKINKFQNSGKFGVIQLGGTQTRVHTNISGEWVAQNGNPIDPTLIPYISPTGSNYKYPSVSPASQGAYNALVKAGKRNPVLDMTAPWMRQPVVPTLPTSIVPQQVEASKKAVVKSKPVVPEMNFTEEERKVMMDAGYDPTNALSVQKFILSKLSDADLGARSGVGIADGYWGNKSATAFQALRDNGIFTAKKEEPIEKSTLAEIPQPVFDAPDLGYQSAGKYEDPSLFKTSGIRDWTTMMNYIQSNTNSAFALDMMYKYGSDLSKWSLKKIEKDMGVSGNYGRRDRSRIQNFLVSNQETWNKDRTNKINQYINYLASNGMLGDLPGLA